MHALPLVPETIAGFLGRETKNWWPQHIDESVWLEHTPFAAWLMDAARPEVLVELGTYRAVSYLAFCQAARQMATPTRCFAVDTWHENMQTEAHENKAFERVSALNAENYAAFSTLIRSTSSDALCHFDEKSIDLLHIYGSDTHEDASRDFYAWLPKISNKGIVLFRGIGVRGMESGVWRLWDELKQRFPSFSFSHGYGLGILAVGKEIPPALRFLFEQDRTGQALRAVREAFTSLGARVATSYHARVKAAGRRAISDTSRNAPLRDAHSRKDFLLAGANSNWKILEIGPLHGAIADKKSGWDTKIVDHATREGLVKKYQNDNNVDTSLIEAVDFVWHSGRLDQLIPEELHGSFDLLIASHVIEHFPDPVGVLKSAKTLLRPDTGVISLAVPDKRLCFDFFRPLSTTGKLLAAYHGQSVRHSRGDLFDGAAYTAFVGESYAWGWQDTSAARPANSLFDAYKAFTNANEHSGQEYQDCHTWMFTPASFELLILEISALGVLDWHVQSIVPMPTTEFLVHLARGRPIFASEEALEKRRATLLGDIQRDLYKQAMHFCGIRHWTDSFLNSMNRL